MPACSVIVCTRRRAATLRRCLDALGRLEHSSYEVLVVDNTAGDEATELVASKAGARYIKEPLQGLSRARNTGAQTAAGALLAFLDDDAIAEPAWLGEHARALEDPTLSATTGRILPLTPGQAGVTDELFDLGERPFQVDGSTPHWFDITNFGGMGFGGNMVLRRQLFGSGFRFRESLGAGAPLGAGEELYAFFTLVKTGHRIAYLPKALVRHNGPPEAMRRTEEIERARRHAGYVSLLLVEEPGFRRNTSRHVFDALRRRRRPWRYGNPATHEAGRLRLLAAATGGPLVYLRSRRHP